MHMIISAKWTKWIAEILFSFDVVPSVCLSVCSQRAGQSDQFKTVKATDFEFDTGVSMDSPDRPLYNFSKRKRG